MMGKRIHGKSNTPEFKAWDSMKQRCLNLNNKAYKNYGGRGIKICDLWLNSFNDFLDDMGLRPSNKHSLDRINNNEGYYKENCRWSTNTEQNRNKRTNVNLKSNFKGISFREKTKKYEVRICVNNKRIHIGSFINLDDAINKRLEAEKKYWNS